MVALAFVIIILADTFTRLTPSKSNRLNELDNLVIELNNLTIPFDGRNMPDEKILICGAGVAGSVLAFWLARYGFLVDVIERSRAEQKAGQGLEIEEPALTVVKLMGILDRLYEKQTAERGFSLVNEHSDSCGIFEMGRMSPTGSLELMRGDLTEVLYKAADEHANVTYHFGTTIQSLRQTRNKVIVELRDRESNTSREEEYDMVIGADGVKSQTRQLTMGSPETLRCYKPVGAFVAYFSIPKEDQDWPYSRLCNFKDRRVLWMRPTGKDSNTTSVYLIYIHKDGLALRQANATGDRLKQKAAFADIYSGLGWEVPRVIEQMMKADNFYSDELSQVKLEKWSRHRVVLVGDAAWAPTPFTGEGNQLAIIGAWVLAQELSRNRSPLAYEMYEERLRKYVENAQEIPLRGYAPYIFVPQTSYGIWILRVVAQIFSLFVRFISRTNLVSMIPEQQASDFNLQIGEPVPGAGL